MELINLGDYWDGHDDDDIGSIDGAAIDYIVDPNVADKDMACGGREKLDKHLRQIERIEKPCGQCAARSRCMLGEIE